MIINLKKLSIVNFKGIKSLDIDYSHTTSIYGDNATGKTTIFDAFLWLFFGKNCEGISQFEVKRLDEKNNFIKDIESEVTAIIHVDNQEIAIKKVLRQKWVTRRGEIGANYNGDENVYFWNDVPYKESEFKAKIKTIVDELLFRLITNPFYFNSLKWQERRNTLIDIAGNISNDDVFNSCITVSNKGQFNSLINALNQGKSVDEFKREIAAKKKKIKDEAENIPSRIDEVKRGMPEQNNFEILKVQFKGLKDSQLEVQNKLNDAASAQTEENNRRTLIIRDHNQKVQDSQQQMFTCENKMRTIQFEAKQKATEEGSQLASEIKSITAQINDKTAEKLKYSTSIAQLEASVKEKNSYVDNLRMEYETTDAKELVFDDQNFHCPACKQSLPETDVESKKEELTKNFNNSKRNSLEVIINNATNTKQEITALNERIAKGQTIIDGLIIEIDQLNFKLASLNEQAEKPVQSIDTIVNDLLFANAEYQDLFNQVKTLKETVIVEPTFSPTASNDELKLKLNSINDQILELQKELNKEDLLKKCEDRVIELKDQESKLAQELADLEGTEFAIMQFTKAKVDEIERKINGRFQFVKFKMFDTQVNGGEVECCETLVNSNGSFVPFTDANNAAKINAGIDIINTLCKHYNIYAPIFIDNRESVTRLIDSDSQIVNLIVSEQDKKLRVA